MEAEGPRGFYLNMGNLRGSMGILRDGGMAFRRVEPLQRSRVSLRVCTASAVTSRYK